MEYPLAFARIDLDAIRHNIQTLKSRIPPKSKFMAVVKADGYGHGAVQVAKKALNSGGDWLGVARLEEALELRDAGIDAPILVFGYIHPDSLKTVVDKDLIATAYNLDMANTFSERATSFGKPVKLHLKIDTGMGRLGMIAKDNDNILTDIETICRLPYIEANGIYTHFAAADTPDILYTEDQIKAFTSLLSDLKKQGIEFEVRHAANSAGIINFPSSHLDMVRAGISLYGCYPSNKNEASKINLKPAMTLNSVITSVKEVPKGFNVSYAMTHQTTKKTRLASVPLGYADGFSRGFSSNGFMLVNGKKAPIVGRVCMDQIMIDVGDIPNVAPGDEVVILGTQGNKSQSAEDLAQRINTINYEIVSALTARVKKIYFDSSCISSCGSASG